MIHRSLLRALLVVSLVPVLGIRAYAALGDAGGSHRWGVVINGDTEERHRMNADLVYEFMQGYYHIPPDHIYFLSTRPGKGGIQGDGVGQNVMLAARQLAETLTADDELRKILIAHRPTLVIGNIHYRVFKTKDSYIVVGALSAALRKKLCAALGVEDKRIGDPNYDPTTPEARAYAKQLVHEVETIMATRTTTEWLALFDGAGVPAGPFKFTWELVDDPQVLANDLQVSIEHPLAGTVRMVGPALQMSQTRLEVQGSSPALGEHTDEVLASIGFSAEEIGAMRDAGAIR